MYIITTQYHRTLFILYTLAAERRPAAGDKTSRERCENRVKTLLNGNRSVLSYNTKTVAKGCGGARPVVSKAIVLQAADAKPRQNG